MNAQNKNESLSLQYSNQIFDGVLEWYKNADTKAQIILTLDGAFLAFLTSSIFMEQDKLAQILLKFGIETWVLLFFMCLALASSILSAIACLWSRIYTNKELDHLFKSANMDLENADTYKPEFMLFFQFLSRLKKNQIAEKLSAIDEHFLITAFAYELPTLSSNVIKKHKWVNRGFILVGSSLILFLGGAVSYLIRMY